MASKAQIQFVTRNMETLRRESHALVTAVNVYVERITSMGQSWVNNQGGDGPTFRELSATLAESVTLIEEKLDDFPAELGAEGEAGRPSSTPQQSSPDPYLSFTVQETMSLSSPKSSQSIQQPSDQLMAHILNRLDNLENDHVKIKDLDQRLGQIVAERREVDREKVKEVEGRLDHLDNNLKNLTTFVDRMERMEERMKALPGLDEQLKMLEKARTVEMKTVDDMKAEVTSLAGQLQLSNKQPVGFTAWIPGPVTLMDSTQVTVFTKIITNIGENYNPSTGEFTAPVGGMYLSSLTHKQDGSGERMLYVRCKRKAGDGCVTEINSVYGTCTMGDKTNCTDVCVVYMSTGDRLFVESCRNGIVIWPSSFSCCLIG